MTTRPTAFTDSPIRVLACCALAALLVGAAAARAQTELDSIPDRGFQPAGSYSLTDIETINTTNGNLILQVPLASLPAGRGGHPGFSVKLLYNSKVWDSWTDIAPDPLNPSRDVDVHWLTDSEQGGWRYNLSRYYPLTDNRNSHYESPCAPTEACGIYIWKLRMHYPDGSLHEFRPVGHDDYFDDGYYSVAPSANRTYYSTDGSFARLEYGASTSDWTLYFPDGTRVVNTAGNWQRTYDRNGNYTELQFLTNYSGTGREATRVVDQMGRSVTVEFNGSEDYVRTSGVGGVETTTTVRWKSVYVRKTYNARTHFTYNVTWNGYGLRVVDQIILPTQLGGDLRYTFGYNAPSTTGQTTPSHGWGEVSSVTLPSGAKATYQYDMDGQNGGSGPAGAFVTYKEVLKNHPTRKDLNHTKEYNGATAPAPTETWLYSTTATSSTVTAPDGGVTEESFGSTESKGVLSGLVLKSKRPDGTVVERIWQQNRPGIESIPANVGVNTYVKTEFTSIPNAAGTLVKTAIRDYSYDKNGNLLRVSEYDWVTYDSVPRDAAGRPAGIPTGAPLRREAVSAYHVTTPDASVTGNAANTYHLRGSPRLLRSLKSVEVGPGGGQRLSRSEYFYDSATTTGNLTQQKSWDSTKGAYTNPLQAANSTTASFQYDAYGNLTLATDARGTQTQTTYGDVGGFTGLYPTEVKAAFNTAIQRTTSNEYDFHAGLVTRTTDVDNGVSTATAYDVFGRPTLIKAAEGETEETRQVIEYSDVTRRVITRSDLSAVGDGRIVTIRHFDQLGRLRLSRQLETAATQSAADEALGIKVQVRYITSGGFTYQVVSQPYRASSPSGTGGPTRGWTRMKRDAAGRVVEVQTFQGASLPAPWGTNASGSGAVTPSYDAEYTTVTDQAGKVRRSVSDAFGQLVRLDEPDADNNLGAPTAPAQPTSYAYNAQGKLTQITQGAQTRTYRYSSGGRLISVTSPETGTLNFTHDADGNMLTRTDALGLVSTYTYDALGRSRTVDFSNTTVSPDIERVYDGATHGKGRFWYSYAGGNSTAGGNVEHLAVDTYDALGRVKTQRRVFKWNGAWSANFNVQRTYDLAGNVLTQTYPSGRGVSYGYDAAGRLNDFRGGLGDGVQRAYATNFVYDEHGRRSQEQFGTDTAVYNKHFYNNSGQLSEIRVSTYGLASVGQETNWNRGALINRYSNQSWSGTGTDNNGNLLLQMIYVPNDDAISGYQMNALAYTYDSLNRLDQVEEFADGTAFRWRQDYDYDRYGNRTVNAANTTDGTPEPQYEVEAGTNRLYASGDTQRTAETKLMRYNAAGNLVYDIYTGQGARTYDAENRLLTAQDSAGQTSAYSYDADGKRVRRKAWGGQEVWQIHGMGGELLAEYAAGAPPSTPQKENGYRGGQLLVQATAPVSAGAGLRAQYFDDKDLTNLKLTRTDAAVNFDWGGGSPHASMGADMYSVRWVGKVQPRYSQTYTFHALTDDGVRLWVNNQLVIDKWVDQGPTEWSGQIALQAGQRYDIRMEFYENFGGATAKLSWSSASQAKEIIPQSQLYPTAGSSPQVEFQWLVHDQLGTPRMVIGKAGTLASVRRHDYLPFGEEIWAGQGGRTVQQGYGAADGVRQQFVGKERDHETGLDYSVNRYYAPAHGRFTTADPAFITSKRPYDPQTINLYAYARNNPVRYLDPDGLELIVEGPYAQRFVDDLMKATGLKLKWDAATGKVTLDGAPPANPTKDAAQLIKLIQDDKNVVMVMTIRDVLKTPAGKELARARTGRPLGGKYNDKGQFVFGQLVDYADVDKFNKPGGSQAPQIALHEVMEAYEGALSKISVPPSPSGGEMIHNAAKVFDNIYRARVPGLGPRGKEDWVRDKDGNPVTTKEGYELSYIDYTTHIEYITADPKTLTVIEVRVEKKR